MHVDDVAAAFVVARRPAGDQHRRPRATTSGPGVVTTIGDIARALSAARGGPAPVVTGQFRLGDVRHVTASSDRLADRARLARPIPLAAGVADLRA